VIRQGHLIAVVVRAFLIGCAVLLLVVGCAGVGSKGLQEEQQGHIEATKEQTGSPEARASEQARCEGTRTTVRQGFHRRREDFLTNDLPSCPKGRLLSGTEGSDNSDGKEGNDEIRGLGERDFLFGGPANDVIYGGPGVSISRLKSPSFRAMSVHPLRYVLSTMRSLRGASVANRTVYP